MSVKYYAAILIIVCWSLMQPAFAQELTDDQRNIAGAIWDQQHSQIQKQQEQIRQLQRENEEQHDEIERQKHQLASERRQEQPQQENSATDNVTDTVAWASSPSRIRADAEKGKPWAQSMLGWDYHTGSIGLKKDDVEAVKWLNKAAKQHDPPAEKWLGEIYIQGQGVGRNNVQAYKWLALAAVDARATGKKDKFVLGLAASADQERTDLSGHMTKSEISQALTLLRKEVPNYSPADQP